MKCRWCKYEIYFEVINGRWVHVETFDGRKVVTTCEPDMQSQLAEPELVEDDAWKQADDLRKRFTKNWEIRSDLEVTALGTQRSVRLRVGDWSFNSLQPDSKRDDTPEPQITDRNVATMRELAEAILAACDFVEKANPKWASHPPLPPIVIRGPR